MTRLEYALGFLVALGLTALERQALGDVADFQDAVQDHPNLTHQYTFDGDDPFERIADKRGTDDLTEQAGGSATVDDIVYGVPGFDDSSEAATTSRPPPGGAEFSDGANFRIPSIALGDAFSFEVIFRPGQEVIEGGDFNLGYILANRIDNDRGYFLLQGSSEQDAGGAFGQDGDDLASIIGTFSTAHENTLLETIEVGHWYYAAGSYFFEDGVTTFSNYIADLTAGESTLSAVGPIDAAGSYGRDLTGLSIGGRFDGPGEAFPGDIDEVNLYDDALDEEDFQAHLDQLLGGEAAPVFHRGDPNDDGVVNITDGVYMLNFLFGNETGPLCTESADPNDDGTVNITDGVYILNFLFSGGPAPVDPGPTELECGPDPEGSAPLGCESYSNC